MAVWSLRDAVRLFQDTMAGQFIAGGDDSRLGIRTMQFKLPPGSKVELMQPVRHDSYLHRYLERRGEGFHHITLFVDDVLATIDRLTEAGFEVVDTELSRPGWKETFIRPRSGFGALIQLAEANRDWSRPIDDSLTVEEVLNGGVRWVNDWPRRLSDLAR